MEDALPRGRNLVIETIVRRLVLSCGYDLDSDMAIPDYRTLLPHRERRELLLEVSLTMLVFSALGAITWAIRGTSGWNGIDGTIVPGMTWGILWWYVCWRKGISSP